MLRRAIIAYGLLALAVAVVLLFTVHIALTIALYLLINGAVIVGAVLLERRGYRPAIDRGRGIWLPTGERFVDPASGQLMEVQYNAETGQRNYVAAEAQETMTGEQHDER